MSRPPKWTRDEVVIALKLYSEFEDPRSIYRISANSVGVQETAMILSARLDGNVRKPTSVSSKILNLARFDPKVMEIGKVRMNGSKIDEEVWKDFHDGETLLKDKLRKEYERIIHNSGDIYEGEFNIEDDGGLVGGYEVLLPRAVRVNQNKFRDNVLNAYSSKCCVTGIDNNKLLVASHILPWKNSNERQRTDPCNGLCLNGLFDRAFDRGLMTVNTDYTIEFADSLQKEMSDKIFEKYFKPYEGEIINLPVKYKPKKEYLEYHNKNIFNI